MEYKCNQCICPKCGTKSVRPMEFINEAECHCCGFKLNPMSKPKEQPFEYICATCGHIWSESYDKASICPECGSFHIVIKYDDINKDLYSEILENYNTDTRFEYKCPACGQYKQLYSEHLHNILCYRDGEFMTYTPENLLEELKKYRKLHRMSQGDMAKKLKISQQFYSKIERGISEIPLSLMPKIMRFTTNPY